RRRARGGARGRRPRGHAARHRASRRRSRNLRARRREARAPDPDEPGRQRRQVHAAGRGGRRRWTGRRLRRVQADEGGARAAEGHGARARDHAPPRADAQGPHPRRQRARERVHVRGALARVGGAARRRRVKNTAGRIVARLLAIQIVSWGTMELLVVVFAPRLLLLDPSVVEGSARLVLWGSVATAVVVVAATAGVGRQVRPLLLELTVGAAHVEPRDVHVLYDA